ncbi:hypothetical protein LOAG_10416 [Loa loa]|uniref:Uncharacterized protein n=1 Tax=Loa loa TaxID=7209 RepID=A0A1S0TRG9_LOALO|nr:hypothetical protein LOAG_10416 [Loa loa]EFO18081.2 hypothetical protein LOAG_10416 [Loa loa]
MALYSEICNDEVGLKLYAFIDGDNMDHLSELNAKDLQHLKITQTDDNQKYTTLKFIIHILLLGVTDMPIYFMLLSAILIFKFKN